MGVFNFILFMDKDWCFYFKGFKFRDFHLQSLDGLRKEIAAKDYFRGIFLYSISKCVY